MNRQMRRISDKSEKKREKEKAEKVAARRAKITARREGRRAAAPGKATVSGKGASEAAPSERRPRKKNRFIGALFLVNLLVVSYGAFLPTAEPAGPTTTDMLMNGLLYVTLAYFLCRWLLDRNTGARSPYFSVFFGLTWALGLELAKLLVAGLDPNPVNLLFILPALLLGAFGGVFIDRKLHGN